MMRVWMRMSEWLKELLLLLLLLGGGTHYLLNMVWALSVDSYHENRAVIIVGGRRGPVADLGFVKGGFNGRISACENWKTRPLPVQNRVFSCNLAYLSVQLYRQSSLLRVYTAGISSIYIWLSSTACWLRCYQWISIVAVAKGGFSGNLWNPLNLPLDNKST